MKLMIIEDEKAAVEYWLGALSNHVSNESLSPIKEEVKKALKLDWENIVAHTADRDRDKPTLPEGFTYLTFHQHNNASFVFGVKGKNLIVLLVSQVCAVEHVKEWLRNNIPDECLSFLDYKLAGNPDAKIAEKLVPHLAKSWVKLCVNHSSTMGDLGVENIGLDSDQLEYYKEIGERLSSPHAANRVVAKALEFWKKHNSEYTAVCEVDRVITWYVKSETDSDFATLSNHEEYDDTTSTVRTFLKSIKFKGDVSGDELKGLFNYDPSGQKKVQQKYVLESTLQHALKLVGLEANLNLEETGWVPPFLPGILFLSQLRLIKDSFSHTNGGQYVPPQLNLTTDEAVLKFSVNIENDLNEQKWWEPGGGGRSCGLLRSMKRGELGVSYEGWKTETSAKEISDLLSGERELVKVKPSNDIIKFTKPTTPTEKV